MDHLLKPRWIVIALYPQCPFEIGEILDRDWGWDGDDEIGYEDKISHYPYLFKPLQWWEERSINEMPEYVTFKPTKALRPAVYRVMWDLQSKIDKRFIAWDADQEDYPIPMQGHIIPATKEQYEQYINSKQS